MRGADGEVSIMQTAFSERCVALVCRLCLAPWLTPVDET